MELKQFYNRSMLAYDTTLWNTQYYLVNTGNIMYFFMCYFVLDLGWANMSLNVLKNDIDVVHLIGNDEHKNEKHNNIDFLDLLNN